VSGSHLRYVPAEYSGSNDPGLHGRHCVREAVASQEAHTDVTVQSECRHMPARRPPVPHVPGGRHAEVSHCGGACQGAAHQEEGAYQCHYSCRLYVQFFFAMALQPKLDLVLVC
jgi:hypothetical protein